MTRPERVLAGMVAIFAGACTPQTTVDLQAESEALRAVALAYHEAAATSDFDGVAALYAEDGAIYAPDTPDIEGMPGIHDFAAGFGAIQGLQVELELVNVVVSSDGAMGYTLGVGSITMDGPDGQPVVEHVRDFHVWTKDANGEWKLAVDIWNSPVPLPDPAH